MPPFRSFRRTLSLTVCLLSACAATEPDRSGGTPSTPAGALSAYLTGRMALNSAEFDRAATNLLEALEADPRNGDLQRQAFVAALIANRPETTTLSRTIPENPIARLYLATADARAGRWAEAEKGFSELPNRGPLQAVQPILVAWMRFGAGHADDAMRLLRAEMDGGSTRSLAMLHAALIADLAGLREEADHLYMQLAANPSEMHVRLAFLLAGWNMRVGRPEVAQSLMDQVQAAIPDAAILRPSLAATLSRRLVNNPMDGLAETFLAFGSSLRSQNTTDLALMVLTLALQARPDFSAAQLAISDTHLTRRHTAAALKAVEQVRDNDILGPLARLRQAALLERLDRWDDAIAILRALAADVPDSGVPDRHLGDVYRVKSRFREAITAYDRAISRLLGLTRADWIIFYHRGIALDRDGQWDKAEADFEEALRLAPEQPYALNYLAYSWTEKGRNLDRARAMLERAVRVRPNDGAITDSLGWVLFRQGHLQEALRLLERATELEPDDPTINGHLGDVYWAVGRRIEALYQWRRALTLNPSAEEAAQLEQKIRPGYAGPVPTAQ